MRARIAVLPQGVLVADLEERPVDDLQPVGPAGHEDLVEHVVEVVAGVLGDRHVPPDSTGISIEAAKSAGPKMIVSSRGDASQISSTLISPRAVSIWASMPTWPIGQPGLRSRTGAAPCRAATTWAAFSTFGSMISSSRSPASGDDLDDVEHGPLRRPVVDPDAHDLVAPVAVLDGVGDDRPGRPPSPSAPPSPRGRGTPCRPGAPGPSRRSGGSSRARRGRSGGGGRGCARTWTEPTSEVPGQPNQQRLPCDDARRSRLAGRPRPLPDGRHRRDRPLPQGAAGDRSRHPAGLPATRRHRRAGRGVRRAGGRRLPPGRARHAVPRAPGRRGLAGRPPTRDLEPLVGAHRRLRPLRPVDSPLRALFEWDALLDVRGPRSSVVRRCTATPIRSAR